MLCRSRNVGTGVALVTHAYLAGDGLSGTLPGYVSQPAVPIGEKLRAHFRVSLVDERRFIDADPMWAVVRYTDAGGQNLFHTRAAVRETYHNVLEVIRVDVHRGENPEPFLTVGTPLPW